MNTPLISVLLPVYNGEKFLNRHLASLEKQTYKNFELLVCDDASTDASLEKLSEWVENTPLTVQVQKNAVNLGVGPTQFKNFQASSGKYVTLAAQDHIWHKDRLQEINYQINNTGCKFVYSAYEKLNKNNKAGTVMFPISNLISLSEKNLFIFRSDLIPLDTITLHRSLMEHYLDCIKFSPIEDLALTLNAMRKSKEQNCVWTCINRPLIQKVHHESNLSTVFPEDMRLKLNELMFSCNKNKMMLISVAASGYIVYLSKFPLKLAFKKMIKINTFLLILGGVITFYRLFLRYITKLSFLFGSGKPSVSKILNSVRD